MLINIGTVIARKIAGYVKSRKLWVYLTAFFSFSALFICLLADMVKIPPRIRIPLTEEDMVALPGTADFPILFSLPLRY